MDGKIIAFAGKGGSGKTTLTALTLRRLIARGVRPLLAVDADPNATLALALGIEGGQTIADLRDAMGEAAQKVTEIPKERLMDQWLAELLNEQTGFDMLTMGRPEGPKCYCYVNGLLRRYLSMLRSNYPYVLVDCEAGMEYLSRLVVDDVEALVMVAEATPVGLKTVERIYHLVDSLPIQVRKRALVINKEGLPGFEDYQSLSVPDLPGLDAVIQAPFDLDLTRRSASGRAIDNEAGEGVADAVDQLADLCLGTPAPSAPPPK